MSCLNRLGSCTCSLLQYPTYSECANLIFVRFRKPRWRPKAQSKIFKVREPTPIDPVEYEKMKEWTAHYNTAHKSILRYIRKHDEEMNQREALRNIKKTITLDDAYDGIVAKNAAWNEETAKIREAELAAQAEVDVIRKQKLADRDVRELDEIREKARRRVLQVQELKDNYVTKENLDDVLEEALNTRAHYEFALNPDGTILSDPEPEHIITKKKRSKRNVTE